MKSSLTLDLLTVEKGTLRLVVSEEGTLVIFGSSNTLVVSGKNVPYNSGQ